MKQTTSFKEYINSQLRPLCARFGVLLLLYSLLRILFFIANVNSFPNTHFSIFFYGIRFDVSAICYYNLPYIVAALLPFSFYYTKIYQTLLNLYFIIINCFAALISYIDIAYYPYVLKRMTSDFFSYLQIGFDFQTLLPAFFKQFWYLLLIFLVTIVGILYVVKFTRKMITQTPVFHTFSFKNFLYKTLIFLFGIIISIIGMRGGLQTRPLGLIATGKHASIQNAPLISNTPFTFIISFGKEQHEIKTYFQDLEEAENYYSPVINTIKPCTLDCLPVKNVMIIVLESFSQYLITGMELEKDSNEYQGYCPFLYSLLNQSLSFNGIASGHRTIDGLPAIFGGIPKLLNNSYVETSFANNYSYSPIEILKNHGFQTLFFHGAKNGSMNIDNYCYSIGFDKYFGKNEYPNSSDFDGFWGISDRSYLKYVAKKLNKTQQPFFAGILTLSSHHPYVIPKDAEGLDIKKGTHPIHAVASYTDYAIKEFFEEISQYDWYKNTLFIFTGDHTGTGSLPETHSRYMRFQIPIFFYHPLSNHYKAMGIMQQPDIMPTLLSYLHINEPLFSYGNNSFDSTYTCYATNYLLGVYQLITDDFILQFDGEKSIGFYDIHNDILMKNNLLEEMPEEVAYNEQKLKAIMQSYTTRMNKNQLFINNP